MEIKNKAYFDKFSSIVVYGVGQTYLREKDKLKEIIDINYLFDRKWESQEIEEFDGIPILKKQELLKLNNPLIVIASETSWVVESIQKELNNTGFTSISIDQLLQRVTVLRGSDLKKLYINGQYKDLRGNEIKFDQSIDDNIIITFRGKNNKLYLDKNIGVRSLRIRFGNNGTCRIGKGTEIMGAYIYVSESEVEIGENCLFSTDVILRTHDSHHIFCKKTNKRINYAKSIVLGNQIWIGNRVTILGGTKIGDGSIVGCNSVLTSEYEDHKIIAGVPGKVIRNDVYWSKDSTDFYNWDFLEECYSQDCLNYTNI